MSSVRSVARLAVALSCLALAACGGGGGGDPANQNTAAAPSSADAASNNIVIESGSSSKASGAFTLDSGTKTSYTFGSLKVIVDTYASSTLEVDKITPSTQPSKYILIVSESTSDDSYACASAGWSDAELRQISALSSFNIPPCPASVAMDAGQTRLTVNHANLVEASNASKHLNFSLNLNLSQSAVYPSEFVVEAGSDAVQVGTYTFTDSVGASELLAGQTLGLSYWESSGVSMMLAYPQGRSDKFIVAAMPGAASAQLNGSQSYATLANFTYRCVSQAWTAADLKPLETALGATLPYCPSTVSFNANEKLLTLPKLTLHAATNANKTLVISVNARWPAPEFSGSTGTASPSPTGTPSTGGFAISTGNGSESTGTFTSGTVTTVTTPIVVVAASAPQ
jgi:hypothetical protein